jgi:hypothetical protein
LTGWPTGVFGWLYKRTADSARLTQGEAWLEAGVRQLGSFNAKEPIEGSWGTFSYLKWRLG